MIYNIVVVAGMGCIVYAACIVHPALAWFAAGLFFVSVGIGGVVRTGRSNQKARR
jgi:hypothetical protein